MLLLLSDVRKKLLALWLGFTALLLLFFLLQFLNGKYADIEGVAWTWVFAQLLPGLGVLWAATLLNLNAGKAILRWAFWGIAGLAGLFLVFVLVSLVGISGGSAGLSLTEGFEDSYRYLLPLQGLVLAVFGLLFFKKESIFQPNANILRDHVGQQLAKAQAAGQHDRQHALELCAAGDLPAMLDFLEQKLTENKPAANRLNDLILLKNQLANLRRQSDLGLADPKDTNREFNRVCVAALGLVELI
ncbi:MAG: hypothetical protein ACK4Q5_15865 [Saprospiraceae bacterium]